MKILFIIFCLLFLSVCDDKIDERLKKFAFDIIEHPEKLRDLKKFNMILLMRNILIPW